MGHEPVQNHFAKYSEAFDIGLLDSRDFDYLPFEQEGVFMFYMRKRTGLRLIAGSMIVGLVASPAAFATSVYGACAEQGSSLSAQQTNETHGSIQATGVAGLGNAEQSISCSPGPMAMAKSEQAFHTNGTGVQSGTHWILNK